jgi:hypothetical protein
MTECLALLLRILEVEVSILRPRAWNPDWGISYFISVTTRRISGQYIKIGSERFLPTSFPFHNSANLRNVVYLSDENSVSLI